MLSLLIAAIAEFARDYPEKLTLASYEEIIDSSCLVLKYKRGATTVSPSPRTTRRRPDPSLTT